MLQTRLPAVAGRFYPGNAVELKRDVDALLQASSPRLAPDLRPKAIIAPHAGYIYSGPIAASAYALLQPYVNQIKRVVLLGPVHRVWVPGLALPSVSCFDSPLGPVELDVVAMRSLAGLPQVEINDQAHAMEHSLEVHLPFLQTVLAQFRLVPLAVGGANPDQVAEVLERLWGGNETLIVVSTDLSHYLPYEQARQIDADTVEAILNLRTDLVGERACGAHPLNGLLLVARRKGIRPQLLDLRNSGDTAGDRNRVVGYAAFAFTEGATASAPDAHVPATSASERGAILTAMARAAICERLGQVCTCPASPDWMNVPGAVFVTLTQDGRLRGCIGSLQAYRSLREDLQANACAAAFRDPRFSPLTPEELASTRVEVSILSRPEPMTWTSEADALAQLRPGIDGVILEWGGHRGTFLPQVWEQLLTSTEFMRHLKHKAGLPPDFWAADLRLSRYTVEKHKETS